LMDTSMKLWTVDGISAKGDILLRNGQGDYLAIECKHIDHHNHGNTAQSSRTQGRKTVKEQAERYLGALMYDPEKQQFRKQALAVWNKNDGQLGYWIPPASEEPQASDLVEQQLGDATEQRYSQDEQKTEEGSKKQARQIMISVDAPVPQRSSTLNTIDNVYHRGLRAQIRS